MGKKLSIMILVAAIAVASSCSSQFEKLLASYNYGDKYRAALKFYEDGKFQSILIAEEGEINLDTNDVKAFGKCTVETVNNEYLQTRDVSYDAKKQLIYSDSDIKITKDKDVMYGKGFESDTDLKNIVIKRQRIIID